MIKKINIRKLDLVILAGGRGTRLGSITNKIPKPLVKVNGIHFLRHIINYYSKFNFENIFLIVGYKGKNIKKLFHNKMFNLVKVTCIIEKNRKDTGGALYEVKNKIKNDFITANGDSFIDVNLQSFFENKHQYSYLYLSKNFNYKKNKKLTHLNIDKQNFVIKSTNSQFMNSGVYFFKKNIFKKIYNKKISLENDIIDEMILKKEIKGIITKEKVFDIGLKETFKTVENSLLKKLKKPAIFFDRDGVINIDNKYVYKSKDFIFKKNIIKFLKSIKNHYLFIITNQSGIGRGYYKEKDFIILHKKLKKFFVKNKIFFNDVQYCPHHPFAKIKKYRKKCLCRKPGNLMVRNILSSWNIDIKNSYMIGDNKSDEECSIKSKIRFIYENNLNYKNILN